MNERELSLKLDEIASLLEIDNHPSTIERVIKELRKLSNENYAPGNSLSWDAVKPKTAVKKQGGFISKSGKTTPF